MKSSLSYKIVNLGKPRKLYPPRSIVEEPPQHRLITYKRSQYFIPTPWIYYRVILEPPGYLDSMYMATRQVKSKNDWVSNACMLNQYGHYPCYYAKGSVKDIGTDQDYIGTALTQYWSSKFNDDGTNEDHPIWYDMAKVIGCEPNSKILSYWETLSQRDLKKLPWPKSIKFRNIWNRQSGSGVAQYIQGQTYDDDEYEDDGDYD